jgi:HAD superfamily hydrolase (TIGR01509 family)
MPPQSDSWVVFDLIGVLAEPSWRELVLKTRDYRWDDLKHGIVDEDEFWDHRSRDLYRNLLRFRPDRLDLVRELRSKGLRICVATNFSSSWIATLIPQLGGENLVDAWIVSAEVKACKPEVRFWSCVLDVVPPGTLFIDDNLNNCVAARSAGLRTLWAHPGVGLADELHRRLNQIPSGDGP